MKKIFSLILAVIFTFVAFSTVNAANLTINIDGKDTEFVSYNIDGNNYLPLNQLASALSGTDAQFDVLFNESNNSVLLKSDTAFSGSVVPVSSIENPEITPFHQTMFINQNRTYARSYNIGENLFYKLRDIASNVNFRVEWSPETGVSIKTDLGYELNPEEEKVLYLEYANRRHDEFTEQNGFPENENYYSFGDVDNDDKDELIVKKANGITIYNIVDGEVKKAYCDPLHESTGENQYHHIIYEGGDYIAYMHPGSITLYKILFDEFTLIHDLKDTEPENLKYAKRYTLDELK